MERLSTGADPSLEGPRSRTEQKKHTARIAQQRHRQRQKDYITELESQLRLIKESGGDQMCRLLAENARLREELQNRDHLLDDLAKVIGRRRPTAFPDTSAGRPLKLSEGASASSLEKEVISGDPMGDRLSPWNLSPSCNTQNLPVHHRASKVLLPTLLYDRQLQSIVARARDNQHRLSPPTVEDFLHEESPDTLSQELKLYKDPWKGKRHSIDFLAAYWILYLLIRWQATLAPDAFEDLPLWMQPTTLQQEVEHMMTIDQVVWPDLRDEIISLSLLDVDAAYGVLLDIGEHLIIDTGTGEASTVESIQLLVGRLSDIGRWKLTPVFFEKYPQWAWTSAR